MNSCFCNHCKKDLNTRENYIMIAQCVGGSMLSKVYFHPECFEEIAGEEYMQELEVHNIPSVSEKFKDIQIEVTGGLPPIPVQKKCSTSNYTCSLCYRRFDRTDIIKNFDSLLCKTCYNALFGSKK